jgi:hypothetical protein
MQIMPLSVVDPVSGKSVMWSQPNAEAGFGPPNNNAAAGPEKIGTNAQTSAGQP